MDIWNGYRDEYMKMKRRYVRKGNRNREDVVGSRPNNCQWRIPSDSQRKKKKKEKKEKVTKPKLTVADPKGLFPRFAPSSSGG